MLTVAKWNWQIVWQKSEWKINWKRRWISHPSLLPQQKYFICSVVILLHSDQFLLSIFFSFKQFCVKCYNSDIFIYFMSSGEHPPLPPLVFDVLLREGFATGSISSLPRVWPTPEGFVLTVVFEGAPSM